MNKKEGTTNTQNDMHKPQKHFKWKKPDITYYINLRMWNF